MDHSAQFKIQVNYLHFTPKIDGKINHNMFIIIWYLKIAILINSPYYPLYSSIFWDNPDILDFSEVQSITTYGKVVLTQKVVIFTLLHFSLFEAILAFSAT